MNAGVNILNPHPHTPTTSLGTLLKGQEPVVSNIDKYALLSLDALRAKDPAQSIKLATLKIIHSINMLLKVLTPVCIGKQLLQLLSYAKVVVRYTSAKYTALAIQSKTLLAALAQQIFTDIEYPLTELLGALLLICLYFLLKIINVQENLRLDFGIGWNRRPGRVLTHACGVLVLHVVFWV